MSFEPDIGKSKHRASADLDQRTFVERLSQEHIDRALHKQRLRQEAHCNIDPSTGMEYFKPVTGRPPLVGRDTDRPVHEALYESHAEVDSKMRQRQQSCKVEINERANTSHVGQLELLDVVSTSSSTDHIRTFPGRNSAKLNSKIRMSAYADV